MNYDNRCLESSSEILVQPFSITFLFPFRSFSFWFSFTTSLSSFLHFFFPWNVDLLIRCNIRNNQIYFCTMTVFHCIWKKAKNVLLESIFIRHQITTQCAWKWFNQYLWRWFQTPVIIIHGIRMFLAILEKENIDGHDYFLNLLRKITSIDW